MIVAGVVTIIFHRLKQPVVLGYILAGVIIGPHTPHPINLSGTKIPSRRSRKWASSC
ncbi:MAG: cation:proton antiporter [Limisphaerales bacterium]